MRRQLVITVAVIAAIVGCTEISILSGPRTLTAGDTATYVLALGAPGSDPTVGSLYVLAEVPESWSSATVCRQITVRPMRTAFTRCSSPWPSANRSPWCPGCWPALPKIGGSCRRTASIPPRMLSPGCWTMCGRVSSRCSPMHPMAC